MTGLSSHTEHILLIKNNALDVFPLVILLIILAPQMPTPLVMLVMTLFGRIIQLGSIIVLGPMDGTLVLPLLTLHSMLDWTLATPPGIMPMMFVIVM